MNALLWLKSRFNLRLFISRYVELLGLLAIFIAAVYLHWGELNDFPIGIHAWSQSDRYAIALGFLDNGFDFIHPQTFVYNKQFPGGFLEPYSTTITSVDFPIHEYLVALLMKFAGTSSPWVFRTYTLLYSLTGLFFFYLFVKEQTKNCLKAWLVILFILLSPIYFYYQASFIPAVMSLANVMIGYRFYFLYVEKRAKQKTLFVSVFFLLLAALTRTPFVIFLIAVVSQELLIDLLRKNKCVKKWGVFISAFLIIVGYYLFNGLLRDTYGSIFLGKVMPAETILELIDLTKSIMINWGWHYFTIYHWIGIVALGVLAYLNGKKVRFNLDESLLLQVSIAGFGCVCYWLLMIKQFVDHDYYFLDTFFIVVLLGSVLVVKNGFLPNGKSKWIWLTLFCAISLGMCLQFLSVKEQRGIVYESDRARITTSNFRGSEVLLTRLGVHRKARILVIDSYIPNVPLLLMNRKGYVVMSTTYENISESLGWGYDYIVVQNQFFESDIISVFPDFRKQVVSIGGNGKLTVFKKR